MRFLKLGILPILICFWGCTTVKNHSVYADLRDYNNKFIINEITTNFDGNRNPIVERQAYEILQGLITSYAIVPHEEVELEIKLYEKSYIYKTDFIHSLYVSFEIFDLEGKPLGVITEYSTGYDSFNSPEVQEKFITKCILKINEMGL